jgi:hypothetical protein
MRSKTTRARARANKKVAPAKFSNAPDLLAHLNDTPAHARLLDSLSSAERKQYPMTSGLLDYFPDACAEVAHISFLGNQKHNPGEPLHWARGKSMDHADCCARHLAQRGTLDSENIRHTAQLAWRAFALLQEELEVEFGYALPRGAKAPE